MEALVAPKKTDPDPDAGANRGRTVKVAKDIVATARRSAALKDVKVEVFVEPLLRQCVKLIDAEIKRDGVVAVTDRANALVDLTPPDAVGPFTVDPDLATDLARQAGYCRTSIAKLIDPHLRDLVQREYYPALSQEVTHLRLHLPRARYALPVAGKVAAGRPALSAEDRDTFDFAAHFGEGGGEDGDTFMLRVKGTSMIDAHIAPGDFVVLRRCGEAEVGAIVVAMVDGEPTLKKLKRDVDRETGENVLRLHPCNGDMPPVDFKDAADCIVGVMIGVVRSAKAERESARRAPRGAKR